MDSWCEKLFLYAGRNSAVYKEIWVTRQISLASAEEQQPVVLAVGISPRASTDLADNLSVTFLFSVGIGIEKTPVVSWIFPEPSGYRLLPGFHATLTGRSGNGTEQWGTGTLKLLIARSRGGRGVVFSEKSCSWPFFGLTFARHNQHTVKFELTQFSVSRFNTNTPITDSKLKSYRK